MMSRCNPSPVIYAAPVSPAPVPAHLAERIAALETELQQVKAAPFSYEGVWTDGQEYRAGQFCTDRGSLWHCNVSTKTRPGDEAGVWTLAVKRGSPGKAAA